MREPVKSGQRFGRRAIAAVLRHHRHKPMLRYLEYLKSDSQPRWAEPCVKTSERKPAEEIPESYRSLLKQWWLGKPEEKEETETA